MSQIIGRVVKTVFTTQDATAKGIKSARGRVNKFSKEIGSLPGLIAGAGLSILVQRSLDSADALGKTSDKLGVTTEGLVAMRHQARLTANMAEGPFDTALQRMVRRIAEAAEGTGEARGAIKELGLDAEQLKRMGPEKAFAAIADKMKELPDQADRVRLSFKLFDTEGVALANTMREGSEGLAAAAKETERLGTAISRIDASKAEAANDAMFRTGQAVQGVTTQLAIQLAPRIEETANLFTDVITETDILEQSIGGVVAVVDVLMLGAATVSESFDAIGEGIGATGAAVAFLLEGEFDKAAGTMDEFWNKRAPVIVDEGITNLNAIIERKRQERISSQKSSAGSGDISDSETGAGIFDTSEVTAPKQELSDQTQLDLAEARQMDLDNFIMFEQGKTDAVQRSAEARQQIRDLEAQWELDTAARTKQGLVGLANNAQTALQGSGKKGFEVSKKIAIGQALMSTFQSAVNSFNALSSIPIVGPALGAVAAAAAIAAGMKNVQKIKQQKPGGSSAGGAGSFSAPGGGAGGGQNQIVRQPEQQIQKQGDITIRLAAVGSRKYIEEEIVPLMTEQSQSRNIRVEVEDAA